MWPVSQRRSVRLVLYTGRQLHVGCGQPVTVIKSPERIGEFVGRGDGSSADGADGVLSGDAPEGVLTVPALTSARVLTYCAFCLQCGGVPALTTCSST